MKGFKIVVGFCLLFLAGTAVYFFTTGTYAEVNMDARSLQKGDRLDWLGVLFLFVCVAWAYVKVIREDRKIRKTKYRK